MRIPAVVSTLFGLGIALTAGVVGALAAEPARTALEEDPAGWVDLLAGVGAGLNGWTRVPIPPGGKLGERSQWVPDAKGGILLCRGDGGHEWLRWDRELGDFIAHVEWRFVPLEAKAKYNSGIYVRNSADGETWHQAQTGDASGGFLFGQSAAAEKGGKPSRFRAERKGAARRVKPAGEWNTYEITCRGSDLRLVVNGGETAHWPDCGARRGFFGLEAEGFPIEFRNVKVKPL